jgi:hypothetical protein
MEYCNAANYFEEKIEEVSVIEKKFSILFK